MAPMLPKLFFLHFEGTSFVAEDDDGTLVGVPDRLPLADRRRGGVHPLRRRRARATAARGSAGSSTSASSRSSRRRGGRASAASPRPSTRDRSRSTSRSASRPRASPRTTTAPARIACCSSSSSASDRPHTGFTEPRLVSAGCPTSFLSSPSPGRRGVAAGGPVRSCSPSSSWSWLRPSAALRCPSARRFLPGRRSPESTSVG